MGHSAVRALRVVVLAAIVLAVWCAPSSAAVATGGKRCTHFAAPAGSMQRSGWYCHAPLSMYPGYRGAGVSIDQPTPDPCVLRCGGAIATSLEWTYASGGWTQAMASHGTDSYVYPFTTDWRWVWQKRNAREQSGTWFAVTLDRLYVNWFVAG